MSCLNIPRLSELRQLLWPHLILRTLQELGRVKPKHALQLRRRQYFVPISRPDFPVSTEVGTTPDGG